MVWATEDCTTSVPVFIWEGVFGNVPMNAACALEESAYFEMVRSNEDRTLQKTVVRHLDNRTIEAHLMIILAALAISRNRQGSASSSL